MTPLRRLRDPRRARRSGAARARAACLAAGLAACLAVAVPAHVPADTLREGLSAAEQARWLAVGRLNVSGQGYCTATLVAPDLVLTAAHCLVNRRTGRIVNPGQLHFLAGYRTGAYAAHGIGAAVALVDGFDRDALTVSRDLGLVRLAAPMPARVRPMPLADSPGPGTLLDSLSYGIDRSQLPSMQGRCEVLRRAGPVLYTSCEGVPGVSGGPLVASAADGPRLAAVASSVSTRRKKPLPKGNLLAVVPEPGLIGGLLAALGRDPGALAAAR